MRFIFPLFLASSALASSPFLSEIRQLTFAGERSGEGYFSADGSEMVFQSEREEGNPFFQIYRMSLETGDTERVSPGTGKTTCSWIHPSGKRVLFASTHEDPDSEAKQKKEYEERASGEERRYSWDYDPAYEIFVRDDSGALRNLTKTIGYDAEGAFSPDGEWIVFASDRRAHDGSLSKPEQLKLKLNPAWAMEIYRMRADGSQVERLTESPGYDGGPFFNADGTKICWRRFDEKGATAEIWTMDSDGGHKKQLTTLGAMSWAPYFHPSGEYLIFATNLHGFANFELYLVDASGEREPVRVTNKDGFDGLPVFTPDGKRLSWTSKRGTDNKSQIFLAEWDHEAALKALSAPAGDPTITAKEMKVMVEKLASKEMQGRLTGTEGEMLATAYAAKAFEQLGLEPGGDDGSYFQEFEFTAGVDLGEKNKLSLGEAEMIADEDWRPLSFSQTGDLESAEVVFAGYGISAPGEDRYSSYVHLDVADKWVMLFRFMPEGFDAAQRQEYSRYSSLRYKAMAAREKGAKGILVVSGPNSKVKSELVPLTYDASLAGSGVGAISLTDAAAQKILGDDHDLKQLHDAHDTGEMQSGIQLEGVSLNAAVDIVQEKRTGRNVLARLPSGKTAAPVVIGAHIDHLGAKAGPGSLATGEEADLIHYGADDNASGVAALIEIAGYLAAADLPLERDVLFGAWSGEELGLLGSAHFASGIGEGERAYSAYLNMDMIGRFREAVVVQGVGSSPSWPALIEQRNAPVGLQIQTQIDSYLPTDATSFYLKGVPVLSAFTGSHEDYHKPSDTPEKLDYATAARIGKFMGLLARGLATDSEIPAYAAMEKPENLGRRASLRAYLGTVPDYAQGDVPGVRLSGVAKNGPAETAGVRGGDVIVKLAGKDVKNIYDYTFVIEALKIGEEVEVTVLRDGGEVSFPLTPGSRD